MLSCSPASAPGPLRHGPARGTFHAYVHTRSYAHGRGTREAWSFIAFARGAEAFPQISRWSELAEWLEGQTAVDNVADASRELAARGLAV